MMFERLRQAIAAAPGVTAAAVSVVTPISGSTWNNRITVPGYDGPEEGRSALYNRVTPDYFRVMSTPILAGRDIAAGDRLGTPRVLLVNEAFVKKYFRGQQALGRSFTIGDWGTPRAVTGEVVGVVADAKYRTLREEPQPTMYAAWAQEETAASGARVSIQVNGAASGFRQTVLKAIESVHKEIAVDFRTFDEDLRASVLQERLVATLSAFFGGLALLLAAIGLYGVMSYSVTRRRSEIGIRMALGAEPSRVMGQVLGNVAWIVIIGLVIGAGASLGAERFVNTLLFNLVGSDLTMILIAAASLGTAAGIAGYLPARRAARVDPMLALREG